MKIFDLHCDTFLELERQRLPFDNNKTAVALDGFKQYDFAVQTMAVWVPDNEPSPKEHYKKVLNYGKKMLDECKDNVMVCRCFDDIKNAEISGKTAVILSSEGGAHIVSEDMVDELFADGIRILSLTWNNDNHLAGGALGEGRLTPLGKRVIERINKLNMVLDLSHLNRQSFLDAALIADRVLASHTAFFEIKNHKRNIDKTQLLALKSKNGLAGLTVYPEFVGENVFDGFYKNISFALENGLLDVLAFGGDFDGAEMDKKLCKLEHIGRLFDYLLGRLIPEKVLNALFFENSINFCQNMLK